MGIVCASRPVTVHLMCTAGALLSFLEFACAIIGIIVIIVIIIAHVACGMEAFSCDMWQSKRGVSLAPDCIHLSHKEGKVGE